MNKKQRKRKKALQLKNKKLVKKYPWLMPRNDWTDKPPKNYDYTWIQWGWYKGWDKAFGDIFMEELGAAIEKAGQKNTFRIYDWKEKFGELRLYCNDSGEISNIISKYEIISQNVCCGCGIEAPMINDGWYCPWCYDCFKSNYRRREAWSLKYHPENKKKTDEEIRELYNKFIVDKPDENGEYHMAESYAVRQFSKDGNKDVVYNITDTVNKIRERQKRWRKKTL